MKVTSTAICGSDLHLYGGFVPTIEEEEIIGHEFMGEVIEKGSQVTKLNRGDRVAIPFTIACGHCWFCHNQMYHYATPLMQTTIFAEKMFVYTSSGFFGYTKLFGGYSEGRRNMSVYLMPIPPRSFCRRVSLMKNYSF